MEAGLDTTDWRILRELQQEGRLTNVELARRTGISPPACLRRVRALEKAGVIAGYRAVIDPRALGYVEAFVFVGLNSQAEPERRAFEKLVAEWPIVRECHILSGEVDFLLKCVAADLRAFQTFVIDEMTRAANVESVRTALIIRKIKDAGTVPIP
jgi:DNA-binding Lrp family transcriptional regulator